MCHTYNILAFRTPCYIDAPSREDLITALEIVTDYLTPTCAEKLLAAYGMGAGELNSSRASAAANLKRKADWEQELEVHCFNILLFVSVVF